MGGVSDGFVIPSGEIVHFWGELKAENNGGFTSVRKEIAYGSLEGKSGIRFEAKATNRDFRMNLTPKTDKLRNRLQRDDDLANVRVRL
ncbi:unnamed protein product [Oikopleura dioica]|uniref:Complex I intermediate-associated protein 30, mitochondrial n=1 Tax=Oikopleura dioica TaxID=34765 RepID=E4X1D4_OIKDI|nr:unnamed protein product [Oikopleura dioica]